MQMSAASTATVFKCLLAGGRQHCEIGKNTDNADEAYAEMPCCLIVRPRSCRVLTQRLLHAAARPYFAALERWLCEGRADGTHGEFMIQENEVWRPVLNAASASCLLTLHE